MAIATVKGDVHDIGKNLVDIILSNNGYTVINLGIKQPIDVILKAAEEHNPTAIGLSGLLVKSTAVMKENLEEMNRRNIKLDVVLGGAALTRKFVEVDLRDIYKGKVFYATDAFAGLRIMDELTDPKLEKKLTKAYEPGAVAAVAVEPALARAGSRGMGAVNPGQAATVVDPAIKSNVRRDAPVPRVPFWGSRVVRGIDFAVMSRAVQAGASSARGALADPKEGTILSVITAFAEALEARTDITDAKIWFDKALQNARKALA